MKHFNSNKITKNPSEKKALMGNVLGSFGNNNIRGQHINFLETKLTDNKEHKCPHISKTPFYYSWLLLFIEHVFWLIREFCFHQENLRSDHFNLDYSKLIRVFVDQSKKLPCYSDEDIEEIYSNIVNLIIIRNSHVHGGFPNALPETLKRLKDIEKPLRDDKGQKEYYTKEEVVEILRFHENPMNFNEIKKQFNEILTYVAKAPKISIGF